MVSKKMELDKENVVQALVVMDTFDKCFHPIVKPMGFLTAAGVPLIDLVLESLSNGGVGETILFCSADGSIIKEYVRDAKKRKASWAYTMEVQVIMSETCHTMGDVMREIDAAGLIRGFFILTDITSISNLPFSWLLEQHKQICKKDKGAAMTLVYKKLTWGHPLILNDKPVFIAADANTKKVLLHKKYKPKATDKIMDLPLETILNHGEVNLHQNFVDVNIAICSPSVPPLFADNFDFQTRDDFINGLLINEELLASSLYYIELKSKQYAAKISNWKIYRTVCNDLLHGLLKPLSVESGYFYRDNFLHMGNNNYRHKNSSISRSSKIVEDVVIGAKSQIEDNTEITKSFIGKNCTIGKHVIISNSHILDNVKVKDNCKIVNSFVDDNCAINEGTVIENGTMIAVDAVIPAMSSFTGTVVEQFSEKQHLQKSTSESGTEWENESSGSEGEEFIGFNKSWKDSDSQYSSDSSRATSVLESPAPDDTNIFLHEVIDSLARGFDEKLKCDYLILEINSSRYAYNIQLNEVNFFVVRALLSMPSLEESKNVLKNIKDIFSYFRPVLNNYIKSKTSIKDCLRAVEDSCIKCEWLDGKTGQIVHFLYDMDIVDEDSLLEWKEDLKSNESPIADQPSLSNFFIWLQQASEESESD